MYFLCSPETLEWCPHRHAAHALHTLLLERAHVGVDGERGTGTEAGAPVCHLNLSSPCFEQVDEGVMARLASGVGFSATVLEEARKRMRKAVEKGRDPVVVMEGGGRTRWCLVDNGTFVHSQGESFGWGLVSVQRRRDGVLIIRCEPCRSGSGGKGSGRCLEGAMALYALACTEPSFAPVSGGAGPGPTVGDSEDESEEESEDECDEEDALEGKCRLEGWKREGEEGSAASEMALYAIDHHPIAHNAHLQLYPVPEDIAFLPPETHCPFCPAHPDDRLSIPPSPSVPFSSVPPSRRYASVGPDAYAPGTLLRLQAEMVIGRGAGTRQSQQASSAGTADAGDRAREEAAAVGSGGGGAASGRRLERATVEGHVTIRTRLGYTERKS